jgi:hypothetical protein
MKLRTVKSKLPKSIKRITILSAPSGEGDSGGGRYVVKKKKKKKKKQSKGLTKIFERVARRGAEANKSTNNTYLSRHRRSNRKRRDGWLRDFNYNWSRSSRKGGKKFKLSKIFG